MVMNLNPAGRTAHLRRAVRMTALALLIAFGLAACGDDRPKLGALSPDAVILAFGDSLTYGKGASLGESYPHVLDAQISQSVVNAGISGETSEQGLRRLGAVLEQTAPAMVILCHGGNDILRKLPLEKAAANLREMIRMIRDSGAQVVMLGVPKFGLILDAAPFYQELAEAEQVPIDGEILADILSDNALKADTVHPNAAGYRKLAGAVRQLLLARGAL